MTRGNGPFCGGRLRHREGTCHRAAGAGTEHNGIGRCSWHGGCSPSGIMNAAEQQAKAAAEKFGIPVQTTPSQALRDGLAHANGIVIWLTAQLVAMDPKDFVFGMQRRVVHMPGPGSPGTGQVRDMEVTHATAPHPYLTLLYAWSKHAAAMAAEMGRLGIEERQVRATEAGVALIGRALKAILDDLDLTPVQRAKVAEVAARRIRELTAA